MFRPLALFIGLRYTRAKRRNHFISFISLMSMIGIALGVAVLITVLSVMNGFDQQIQKRVFVMIPQVTVSSVEGRISDWQSLETRLRHYPQILGLAPYLNGQALLTGRGMTQASMVIGIDPKQQSQVSSIAGKMVEGSFANLKPHQFGIVIGRGTALHFGVHVGDKLIVMTPQGSYTPLGFSPRLRRFTVVGIFDAGNGFNFNSGFAYINLQDAQALYNYGQAISGIRLKIQDVFNAPAFSYQLASKLPPSSQVDNWTEQLGAFFRAVAMEKHMMFLILILIIAVAAFNLVSTLVMVVNEKASDIAILRTLGATPRLIMHVFIVQGAVVGLIGTLLGLIAGLLIAWNVTAIVNWLQSLLGVQFISSSVYVVNYLPSRIETSDVVTVCLLALLLSLLATLYPAWRAARTQPAEALRYE